MLTSSKTPLVTRSVASDAKVSRTVIPAPPFRPPPQSEQARSNQRFWVRRPRSGGIEPARSARSIHARSVSTSAERATERDGVVSTVTERTGIRRGGPAAGTRLTARVARGRSRRHRPRSAGLSCGTSPATTSSTRSGPPCPPTGSAATATRTPASTATEPSRGRNTSARSTPARQAGDLHRGRGRAEDQGHCDRPAPRRAGFRRGARRGRTARSWLSGTGCSAARPGVSTSSRSRQRVRRGRGCGHGPCSRRPRNPTPGRAVSCANTVGKRSLPEA